MLRLCLITCLGLLSITSGAGGQVITTVAGTGESANNGDRGGARELNIGQPFGVEIGPDGALYVTEVGNHRVRRVDLSSGRVSTVAGCGKKGYSGDGGPATAAELNEPYEVRFDSRGNMFFVEMQNHVIRRVDAATGIITTIAGTGEAGYAGDDGPARAAQLNRPHSIALDDRGSLYIADIGNHRIRRVSLMDGRITSIAGTGARVLPRSGEAARRRPVLGPRALALTGRTLWVALREGHSVWSLDLDHDRWGHVAGTGEKGFTGDGGPASECTFNGPKGIAVDAAGRILIVDTENHCIRRIDPTSGLIETIAGLGPTRAGDSGDGGEAIRSTMNRPHGICVDGDGHVFVGDTVNHRVRRVTSSEGAGRRP